MVTKSAWPICSWPVTLGGGMDDGEGLFLRVLIGAKDALVEPKLIPTRLNLLGRIGLAKLLRHHLLLLGIDSQNEGAVGPQK